MQEGIGLAHLNTEVGGSSDIGRLEQAVVLGMQADPLNGDGLER